jgi:phage-related protein
MYVVELSLRLSPMPVAVQRKDLDAARSLYREVRQALESGQPKLLELTCEKDEHKSVTLLSSEVVAVQIYEKSAVGGGGKRPGFSLEG